MPNDILLLFLLIVLNGVFAMSEIAIVSARRARLMQMAEAGRKGASHALTLASEPTRFLSSVQVGITSIGILNGAIGEGAIAARLRPTLEQVPVLAPYADTLSLAIMVGVLTYVSLIIGELVPKNLGLKRSEAVSLATAIVCGFAPAFEGSRGNVQEALKDGARQIGAAQAVSRAVVFIAAQNQPPAA